ncbi:MAG: serine protease [Patescibacteria group bacterium]|nr:serine protease [Patescibacteria group bacterium]
MMRFAILALILIAVLSIAAPFFADLIKKDTSIITELSVEKIIISTTSNSATINSLSGASSSSVKTIPEQIPEIPDTSKITSTLVIPKIKTPSPEPKPAILPTKQILPTSIVGLICYFNYGYFNPSTGVLESGSIALSRGSGVIISKNGLTLTNRHVIESDSSKQIVSINGAEKEINVYDLNLCEVGTIPETATLPTPDLIRSINPIVRVPVLGYTAKLIYKPSLNNLSGIEAQNLDFAILKINGISESGPIFGITSLPASFDYAEMLSSTNIEKNDEILTYGFPGDVTEGTKSAWTTIYLTGSVGKYSGFFVGDKFFKETPLVLDTEMEVYPGRSGSPLFWRGYVVGLVRSYNIGNRLNSHAIAIDAIQKIMGPELDNLRR